jgi:hypothetical protein
LCECLPWVLTIHFTLPLGLRHYVINTDYLRNARGGRPQLDSCLRWDHFLMYVAVTLSGVVTLPCMSCLSHCVGDWVVWALSDLLACWIE